jgi:prepilin-type processing-associated H-X9-DG protein
MARRIILIGFVFFVFGVAGLVLTYIPKARLQANLVGSRNNLRALALFAAHHAKPDPKVDASKLPTNVPPGTIYLAGVSVEDRLSWVVDVLPGFDQTKQNTEALLAEIDRTKLWTAEPNQKAGRTRLPALLCPENPPDLAPGAPGLTSYVGIGGIGLDAPMLPPIDPYLTILLRLAGCLGPDVRLPPISSPRSGAFWYDGPTPFNRIDGLSQTLLFGETRYEVGPWLRGGFSTVRGLNDAPGAAPLIGDQFGGYFPNGANFAMCDGSVQTFSPQTAPGVILSRAAITGKAVAVPWD